MNTILTPEELTQALGENIRALRLQKNLTQSALAAQSGVSLSALRHLESGQGANVGTLVRVVRSLDRQDWLGALTPRVTINPLHMASSRAARQRARGKKKTHDEKD